MPTAHSKRWVFLTGRRQSARSALADASSSADRPQSSIDLARANYTRRGITAGSSQGIKFAEVCTCHRSDAPIPAAGPTLDREDPVRVPMPVRLPDRRQPHTYAPTFIWIVWTWTSRPATGADRCAGHTRLPPVGGTA